MNIKLQFLNKNFNEKNIFNIKIYEFKSANIHGIVGPNGGGKTTLLRIIAALDEDFTGIVSYDNSKYTQDLAQNITYLSQSPYMLSRSVYENIAYPLKIRKYSKIEIDKKVKEMLKLLNIEYLSDKKAIKLSAGEKQKVSLARGLIFDPDLVLLDEPTANIDPETVEIIENVIENYQKKTKSTIIIVTHNLSQALRFCDTISVLKNKEIVNTTKEKIFKDFQKLNNLESFAAMDYKILGV